MMALCFLKFGLSSLRLVSANEPFDIFRAVMFSYNETQRNLGDLSTEATIAGQQAIYQTSIQVMV